MAETDKLVTEKTVFAAADALAGAGVKNPSNRMIRDKLGGGSPNEIAPLLRAWKEHGGGQPQHAASEIPQEVLAEHMKAGQVMWNAALAEAHRIADSKVQVAENRAIEAESDRDQALNDQSETIRELEMSKAQLSEASELHKRQAEEIERLREALHKAENQRAESQARVELLTMTVSTLQEANHGLEGELSKRRDEITRLGADLASVRSTCEGLKAEHEHMTQELDRQRETARVTGEELAKFRSLDESNKEVIADLKRRNAEEAQRTGLILQRAEGERDAARTEARELAVANGRLTGELDALRQQVGSQASTIETLTKAAAAKTSPKGQGA